MGWVNLAQDMFHWWFVVNRRVNFGYRIWKRIYWPVMPRPRKEVPWMLATTVPEVFSFL